jgi:hypothetical protein
VAIILTGYTVREEKKTQGNLHLEFETRDRLELGRESSNSWAGGPAIQ